MFRGYEDHLRKCCTMNPQRHVFLIGLKCFSWGKSTQTKTWSWCCRIRPQLPGSLVASSSAQQNVSFEVKNFPLLPFLSPCHLQTVYFLRRKKKKWNWFCLERSKPQMQHVLRDAIQHFKVSLGRVSVYVWRKVLWPKNEARTLPKWKINYR